MWDYLYVNTPLVKGEVWFPFVCVCVFGICHGFLPHNQLSRTRRLNDESPTRGVVPNCLFRHEIPPRFLSLSCCGVWCVIALNRWSRCVGVTSLKWLLYFPFQIALLGLEARLTPPDFGFLSTSAGRTWCRLTSSNGNWPARLSLGRAIFF